MSTDIAETLAKLLVHVLSAGPGKSHPTLLEGRSALSRISHWRANHWLLLSCPRWNEGLTLVVSSAQIALMKDQIDFFVEGDRCGEARLHDRFSEAISVNESISKRRLSSCT